MTLYDSGQGRGTSAKRSWYKYLYVIIFMTVTSVTTVMLSFSGHISLDPLTAVVTSLFAGFAFLVFQTTYLRFVANSSAQSTGRRKQQPDLQ
jgi:hypothetical protein